MHRSSILIFGLFYLVFSCENEKNTFNVQSDRDKDFKVFNEIPKSMSSISFSNFITESDKNNLFTNDYIYSGGGVAIGDLDNDGLEDIYFVSNQGKDALYKNKGNFEFENKIITSGIQNSNEWASGVTLADVNQDGYLDIYLSRGGEFTIDPNQRKNKLYINNKDFTFKESASSYQIDDSGATTQSCFFDFDLDGDLDLYVMNVPVGNSAALKKVNQYVPYRQNPGNRFGSDSDRLYKNLGNGKFEDVSISAGIANWGFGLGIGISDLNGDFYPDIYITNDFGTDNFLYINNRDGTFKESLYTNLSHVSYFAMGMDIADVNNDGLMDIFEVEMVSEDRKRNIENMRPMDVRTFYTMQELGLVPQYMRNSLQINQGYGLFSERAQMAGIAKTDWSWGTVIVDFDHDQMKDIFVANGILRDMSNRDFTNYAESKTKSEGLISQTDLFEKIPSTKVDNYLFKNLDGVKFKNKAKKWGVAHKGFSNGVAYADLDNDGDQDLIVNNLNESPNVYSNQSIENGKNYIAFELKGPNANQFGIGSKVKVFDSNGGMQVQDCFTVRGFQSSSSSKIIFGIKANTEVIKVEIIWPDLKKQILENPIKNKLHVISFKNANTKEQINTKPKSIFREVKASTYVHKDDTYNDFAKEILLPHKLSHLGPASAIGDVNGDGREDLFVGGAKGYAGTILLQQSNGFMQASQNSVFNTDKAYEDIGASLFDSDGDGDLDLFVSSGSNEYPKDSKFYQDRLYLNNGTGVFSKSNNIENESNSNSVVISNDFDKDGDLDLFVGGRLVPGSYPMHPKSGLFINENGTFKNKINDHFPKGDELGMVTDAIWTDFNGDGQMDLVIVGEWMNIKFLQNNNGKFINVSKNLGLENTNGWWFSIEDEDLDKDGDIDFLVGNIGLNHKFKSSLENPLEVFCSDFDENGTNDIVLAFHDNEKFYPVRGRDCSSEQMPFILDKFKDFKSFSNAQMQDVYGDKLDKAHHLKAQIFESIILRNENGKFKIEKLPMAAQVSAINDFEVIDLNKDGIKDILLVGNMIHTEPETSRADASLGLLLLGQTNQTYNPLSIEESGFFAFLETKNISILNKGTSKPLFIVVGNNLPLKTFVLNH